MANDFFENQFVLDTPSANPIKAALAQRLNIPPFLQIKSIRWVGATTAGHACVIQRASDSKVYWESLSPGVNQPEERLIERMWLDDFKLVTLDSGRVYIFLVDGLR